MAVHKRTSSSHGVGGTSQPRQLPGAACEECRKRKLRCKINDNSVRRCVVMGGGLLENDAFAEFDAGCSFLLADGGR